MSLTVRVCLALGDSAWVERRLWVLVSLSSGDCQQEAVWIFVTIMRGEGAARVSEKGSRVSLGRLSASARTSTSVSLRLLETTPTVSCWAGRLAQCPCRESCPPLAHGPPRVVSPPEEHAPPPPHIQDTKHTAGNPRAGRWKGEGPGAAAREEVGGTPGPHPKSCVLQVWFRTDAPRNGG